MTTNEMRELDAWIAEHVMGNRLSGSFSSLLAETLYETNDRAESLMIPSWPLNRYTTDPAAAMQVLEKCVEKDGCAVIYAAPDGGYFMCSDDIKDTHGPTIPLAICLFAKELFK